MGVVIVAEDANTTLGSLFFSFSTTIILYVIRILYASVLLVPVFAHATSSWPCIPSSSTALYCSRDDIVCFRSMKFEVQRGREKLQSLQNCSTLREIIDFPEDVGYKFTEFCE